MKKFLILSLTMLIAIFVNAQSDAQAVDLLKEVSTKMDAYKSLKLDFNVYVEDLHEAKRQSHPGKAIYKAGNYRLELMGQIVFSDGKTNWTYLEDADEVNITDNLDDDQNIMDPKSILKDFEKDFKVRFVSDKFEKNRPLVEIDMIPKKIDDKKYSRITLKVDKSKKQIYSVRYIGKDGVSYLIEIHGFAENPNTPDSEVKYSDNLFPGAEIIDMRD